MKKLMVLLMGFCVLIGTLSGCKVEVDVSDDGTTTTANADTTTTVGDADPTDDVTDPTDDVADPTDDVADPTDDVADPTDDVADPTDDVADPTDAATTTGNNKTEVGDKTTTKNGKTTTTLGATTTTKKDDVTTTNKTDKTTKRPPIGIIGNMTTAATTAPNADQSPDEPNDGPVASTTKNGVTTRKSTTSTTKKVTTSKTTQPTRPPAPDASNFKDVTYVIRKEALDLKLTQEVLDRSILYEGDVARVAAFLKKAMRGEKVTIGFIGGSITQGTAASSSSKTYAKLFHNWFKSTFPNTTVEYVNAGLGATDSLMGVHRVEKDLLSKNPDLVVVEFTVNDPDNMTYRESYEGLMRKILKTDAAVIAVQMMNQEGKNTAKQHSKISDYYDIPTISYKNALWPAKGSKVYGWSEISPDSIHPNDTGHAIVSELLINYINTVRAKITTAPAPLNTLPDPATDNPYETALLLNGGNSTPSTLTGFAAKSNTPQFPNGWHTTGGGTFVLEVEDAKNLSLLYWKQQGASGSASVKIDGRPLNETIKSDNPNSWNYAVTVGLTSGTTAGKHTIEITATGTFWILGILKS